MIQDFRSVNPSHIRSHEVIIIITISLFQEDNIFVLLVCTSLGKDFLYFEAKGGLIYT